MKKIVIIFLIILSATVAVIILQQDKNRDTKSVEIPKSVDIPKVSIPKKSIEFTIEKEEDKKVDFFGSFSEAQTPKEIAKFLKDYKIDHRIVIDAELATDRNATLLVKKVLKKLNGSYISWSIVYKNYKLLVSGKTTSSDDKESVENILELSNVDSFTHIELIKEGTIIVSKLKEAVENENEGEDFNLSDDEAKEILSNLKVLAIPHQEEERKVMAKRKRTTKIKQTKKHHTKKRKPTKVTKRKETKERGCEKVAKTTIVKKEPKRLLSKRVDEVSLKEDIQIIKTKEPSSDDILSLPPIKPVDIHIEEKIQKGIIKPPKVAKPIIKETIYIAPEDDKIRNSDIPWAKLHDVDEKLDGILIDESIN